MVISCCKSSLCFFNVVAHEHAVVHAQGGVTGAGVGAGEGGQIGEVGRKDRYVEEEFRKEVSHDLESGVLAESAKTSGGSGGAASEAVGVISESCWVLSEGRSESLSDGWGSWISSDDARRSELSLLQLLVVEL